ncbi:hypothetical protein Tco_0886128 [Tanacetum coccineum]
MDDIYNDLFPFNIISVNDSKLDTDNDDDKIDIKQSLGDISIEPLPNVISIDIVIIEQRVKVNQKARILELKRRNHEEHCSDNLYAVSIKEDTAYLCPKLHSASTKRRSIRRIQMKPYAVFKYKSWNILEYNNHGAHAKKP